MISNFEHQIADTISAKFRTFDMQIYFAIPPNSALQGLLEEFFFIYQTLDLQRSSLRLGLYAKNSKFMPIKIV